MNEVRVMIGDLIRDSLASSNRRQAAAITIIAKEHDKLTEENKMLREALNRIASGEWTRGGTISLAREALEQAKGEKHE
jgi:hypothetical protein